MTARVGAGIPWTACGIEGNRTGAASGGFTFAELLVIVVIIGILAGIAISSSISLRERGWQAQLVADVRSATRWSNGSGVEMEACPVL